MQLVIYQQGLIQIGSVKMAALEHLSERDKAVLRSIFDPTATIGDIVEDAETDKFVEEDDGMYVLCISIIIVNGILINI